MGDINKVIMEYNHEIAWCKKVIASGTKGEYLKATQMRLKEAEAAKKIILAEGERSAGVKAAHKKGTVREK